MNEKYPKIATNHNQLVNEVLQKNSNIAWFTYRKGFSPLYGSKSTTDAGWGCMIRTGQMLLHEALLRHTGKS